MPTGKNIAPAIKNPHKPLAKQVKICVHHAQNNNKHNNKKIKSDIKTFLNII